MQNKRNLIKIWLLCAALLPTAAQAQFTYTTNNDAITITKYTGSGDVVVIPSTTNGYPVTSIGVEAFLNCFSLTSVTIGTNVVSIGDYAFNSCTNLASVMIPNNVTNMGGWAFDDCSGLTNITISTNITSIGLPAFFGCKELRSVKIPNSVTSIGVYSFSGCISLTNLTISTNLTEIEDQAFGGCISLGSVAIPNSITNIGVGAFGGCTSLTNLTIGTNVTSIGTNAFQNCTKLTSVSIPNSVLILEDFAFSTCSSLTNVTLGYNVRNIGNGAFYACTSLPSVTLPLFLTNLVTGAFNDCDSLVSIAVNGNNGTYSSVGGVLFNKDQTTLIRCPGGFTGSCIFPNKVTKIAVQAFFHCYDLKLVAIPSGVTSIGGNAFLNCYDLTSVYFTGSAPSLGSSVFLGDSNATVYYLQGKSGWSSPFGGLPAVMLSGGFLQVTVAPAGAITAGAQWQVDGGAGQPNGAIVSGLSVGDHTLNFTPANGWATPVSQSVTVSANSVATASGTYVQLGYQTNNGAITITGMFPIGINPKYAVVLPSTINGLPVTSLGNYVFFGQVSLTSVTIPSTITNIGTEPFTWCDQLSAITVDPANPVYSSVNGVLFNKDQTTLVAYPGAVGGSYTIPQSVTTIGDYAFELCASLTSIAIPNSVTNIGIGAFYACTSLPSVMIPNSVTSIGDLAFWSCSGLTGIYFHGNAPSLGSDVFDYDNHATAYCLPGTTGWATFDANSGLNPAVLWLPQAQTSTASFGVQTNQFGFNITWASDTVVVVEACTDLANSDWTPVGTNTLTGGSSYFSDSQWTNYPGRFYRLRSP